MKHKDHYNDDYILDISQKIHSVMPGFDKEAFIYNLTGHLDDKELFPRFDCIVDAMERSMPDGYSENIAAFFHLLGPELEQPEGMFNCGWWLWPIGRYVERHGNEDWRLSLSFLKELTKRFTGELQISPLVSIKDNPERFVQKSVGNNLNALYREATERADFIISQWEKSGQTKAQEWIVRHGRRNQK